MVKYLVALTLALLPGVAAAQLRTLAVPATSGWQHAETGLILNSRVAGLVRGDIRDSTQSEQDIFAAYEAADERLSVTIYLFRTGLPDASLWFDRALTAIRLTSRYGLEPDSPATILPFAPPGQSVPTGLAATFDLDSGGMRGTAVVMAPVADGWLLKVRMTSDRLGAAALGPRLDAFVRALQWPAPAAGAPSATAAAAAILPCPRPLRLRRARIVRPDMAGLLLDALSGAATQRSGGSTPVYCRERGADLTHGVYRADASERAYVIALHDSGVALSLSPALSLEALSGDAASAGGRVAMVRLERDTTAVLPSFDRLPPPDQALRVAEGSSSAMSVRQRRQ